MAGWTRPLLVNRSGSARASGIRPCRRLCAAQGREPLPCRSCSRSTVASAEHHPRRAAGVSVVCPATRTTRLGVGPNPQFTGRYSLSVITGFPGPPDDSDVAIKASLTDVRCLAAPPSPDCDTTPNRGTGPDYLGDLAAEASFRITDTSGGVPATVEDFPMSLVLPCIGGSSPDNGSSCEGNTSMNAVTPGSVKDAQRQNIEVGQVRVTDDDGNLFADEGVFVP